MRNALLAASAAIAIVASGVCASAQENPKREEHTAPQRAEPKPPQGAPRAGDMQRQQQPNAA